MKKTITALTIALSVLMVMSACGKTDPPPAPETEEEIAIATPTPYPVVSEKDEEIREGMDQWQEKYPAINIFWFQIDCHDGLSHYYYFTKGMTLKYWLSTDYNTDNWQEDNGTLINKQFGVRTVLEDPEVLYGEIEEGTVYDTEYTGVDTEDPARPSDLTGEAMYDFIQSFETGVFTDTDTITVKRYEQDKLIASETVYTYENGELTDISVTYYCPDGYSIGYEKYLESSPDKYTDIERSGNIVTCKLSDEQFANYANNSKDQMLETLQKSFELF